MLYPSEWDNYESEHANLEQEPPATSRLLKRAERESYVKLYPVDGLNSDSRTPWTKPAYTKLLAYNLTEFERVLVIDPASQVRGNMDDVFLLPRSGVAMSYVNTGRSKGRTASPQLILASPSPANFAAVRQAIDAASNSRDVDILKAVFSTKIRPLDYDAYGFLTSDLRRNSLAEISALPSTDSENDDALTDVKIIHFSDPPLPQPWFKAPQDSVNKYMPQCVKSQWFGASNCRDRELWFKLYANYGRKRKALCGAEFEVRQGAVSTSKDGL